FIVSHGIDRFRMLLQVGDWGVLGDVPELDGLIVNGGGDLLAIRSPCQSIDAIRVALKGFQQPPIRDVPQFDLATNARNTSACRQEISVWAESESPNYVRMTGQGLYDLPAHGVDQLDLLVGSHSEHTAVLGPSERGGRRQNFYLEDDLWRGDRGGGI